MHAPPSLSDLWSAAAAMLGWLRALFGQPAAFLAREELTRRERREALAYLRPLERTLRALILYMALTMPGPLRPPAPSRRAARGPRPPCWEPADPARWRNVRFRIIQPAGAPHRAQKAAPRSVFSPWPIARRMEALARVMAAPEPYVWRAARTLRAAQAPKLRFPAPPAAPESTPHAAEALLRSALPADTS